MIIILTIILRFHHDISFHAKISVRLDITLTRSRHCRNFFLIHFHFVVVGFRKINHDYFPCSAMIRTSSDRLLGSDAPTGQFWPLIGNLWSFNIQLRYFIGYATTEQYLQRNFVEPIHDYWLLIVRPQIWMYGDGHVLIFRFILLKIHCFVV